MQKRIDQLKEHIEYLTNIGVGTTYTLDAVKAIKKTDKIGDTVIEIQQAKEKCLDELKRLISLQEKLKSLIELAKDHTGRYILYERYILLKEWKQIQKENNYSENHIFKIHKKALEQIQGSLDGD